MQGYLSADYARALSEFGQPRQLSRSGGWLLERSIAETPDRDALGCYPLFTCHDWPGLQADLAALGSDLVSVGLVTDPFGNYSEEQLRANFDRVVRFKEHFLVDLERAPETYVSSHHRYYARKSLKTARVERCVDPLMHLDEWVSLYQVLVERHQLRGLKAFSRASFAKQLQVPGLVMFRMTGGDGNELLALQLWFVQGEVAYSHLTAFADAAYKQRSSYGLYWAAIDLWRQEETGRVRWLNLGAGAGATSDAKDGLTEFKRGWSTETRPAYFCGKVLNATRYDELSQLRGPHGTNYFPAYRAGELA